MSGAFVPAKFALSAKHPENNDMNESGPVVEQLVSAARDGNPDMLGQLLEMHQKRLLSIVEFRIDARLRRRLDAADVLQEAFIEAAARFQNFLDEQKMPFFLWLRFITMQKLMQMHRRHLGTKTRDINREVSIYSGPQPHATSEFLAAHLLGHQTSPSGAAVRAETQLRVERALNAMEELDREVLALRNFEQLSNSEVAQLLELSESAASNRYMRALKRLKTAMDPE